MLTVKSRDAGKFCWYKTSSNQRLGEFVRSKMDSQSVAKEHDRRHTMLFNMPQME